MEDVFVSGDKRVGIRSKELYLSTEQLPPDDTLPEKGKCSV